MKHFEYYQAMKNREQQARQEALNRLKPALYSDKTDADLFKLFLIRVALFTAAAIPMIFFLISQLNP